MSNVNEPVDSLNYSLTVCALLNDLDGLKTKKALKSCDLKALYLADVSTGGERGIRTPGPLTVNGFQDRRIRPLCHLSGRKIKQANLQKVGSMSCIFLLSYNRCR